MIKKCKYCHKEFQGTGKARFCCPDHRILYWQNEAKTAQRLHSNTQFKIDDSDARGRANWREFKRNMKRPKLSIGEISVLARQAGMSYGQYVAKAGI